MRKTVARAVVETGYLPQEAQSILAALPLARQRPEEHGDGDELSQFVKDRSLIAHDYWRLRR
jgi:hypothetical protein